MSVSNTSLHIGHHISTYSSGSTQPGEQNKAHYSYCIQWNPSNLDPWNGKSLLSQIPSLCTSKSLKSGHFTGHLDHFLILRRVSRLERFQAVNNQYHSLTNNSFAQHTTCRKEDPCPVLSCVQDLWTFIHLRYAHILYMQWKNSKHLFVSVEWCMMTVCVQIIKRCHSLPMQPKER